jgi:hypothetical protein
MYVRLKMDRRRDRRARRFAGCDPRNRSMLDVSRGRRRSS